jgi:peptidylprolyl isomerase
MSPHPATPQPPRRTRVLGAALTALLFAACATEARPPMNPDPAANSYAPALGVDLAQFRKDSTGLYVRDDTVGTGAVAERGRTVEVHYTGWLPDGSQFDSSEDGAPYTFALGEGQVIDGWDLGIAGMKAGGARTLVIPAPLGYGSRGAGRDIPPDAVLVFRVRLQTVR